VSKPATPPGRRFCTIAAHVTEDERDALDAQRLYGETRSDCIKRLCGLASLDARAVGRIDAARAEYITTTGKAP
jgi:hypothetical protein